MIIIVIFKTYVDNPLHVRHMAGVVSESTYKHSEPIYIALLLLTLPVCIRSLALPTIIHLFCRREVYRIQHTRPDGPSGGTFRGGRLFG